MAWKRDIFKIYFIKRVYLSFYLVCTLILLSLIFIRDKRNRLTSLKNYFFVYFSSCFKYSRFPCYIINSLPPTKAVNKFKISTQNMKLCKINTKLILSINFQNRYFSFFFSSFASFPVPSCNASRHKKPNYD